MYVENFQNIKKTFDQLDGLQEPVVVEIVEQVFKKDGASLTIVVNGETHIIEEEGKKYLMPFGERIYLLNYNLKQYKDVLKAMKLHGLSM